MKKLFLALPLLLAACGGAKPVAEPRDLPPAYCIREAIVNADGTVTIDMPGQYYGQNDRPITISAEAYADFAVPPCTD